MAIFKRGKTYWMDAFVNGVRYRQSLKTTDRRLAPTLERELIAQLINRAPDPTKNARSFRTMEIVDAVNAYIEDRRSQVSERMVQYWREQSRPLVRASAFRGLTLNNLSPGHIRIYQNERRDKGRAPKTVNGEVSVLRQLLKHAKLWYRFDDEYKPVPNTKPPVGRALTYEEQARLFDVARSEPRWLFAYTAAVLAFYCGMRACEIKGLKWKDVNWQSSMIDIKRSKTPAGWRSPSLNSICRDALTELYSKSAPLGFADDEHFVFPWHGRDKNIDPTRPMTSWRTAWRRMLEKANLKGVRFHDGRHTAITTLAEKGMADWVIQAQVGHVAPQMMKTYSHIRREALNEAAIALEPEKREESLQSVEVRLIG